MSITSLNVSLENYEIGISGAVPEERHWSEPAMDRAILEFVAMLCGLIFKYGGRIVHGYQPMLTPIIVHQARLHACDRIRKPVTLVMSYLWAKDYPVEALAATDDIAELIVTHSTGEHPSSKQVRDGSLTMMRRVLVSAQNVMIAVGGKFHETEGYRPGVEEEMKIAADRSIPRFLIGGLGGYAKDLATRLTPESLQNHLSDRANSELLKTDDISACVGLLFEHMATSERLRAATHQPIKWNKDIRKIVDHRDGTVDGETSQLIRSAVA